MVVVGYVLVVLVGLLGVLVGVHGAIFSDKGVEVRLLLPFLLQGSLQRFKFNICVFFAIACDVHVNPT